jgi:hypothetical protein
MGGYLWPCTKARGGYDQGQISAVNQVCPTSISLIYFLSFAGERIDESAHGRPLEIGADLEWHNYVKL